ncbi:unnamed protein product, partial [Meganyctiphanes norvegica]
VAAELMIANDVKNNIFKELNHESMTHIGIRNGIDGSKLITTAHSSLKHPPPLLYRRLGSFCSPIYNLHSGEFGYKRPCPKCPNEDTILTEEYAEVVISITVSAEAPFLSLFLIYLHKISYSKSKIHLRFIIENERKGYQKIKEFLKLHAHEYQSTAVHGPVVSESTKDSTLKIWDEASTFGSYLFILDSSVYVNYADIIQFLINKNRNVIGPLLMIHENHHDQLKHNIASNYENGQFQHGPLTEMFINKMNDGRMNFIGIFQVAYISHAVLMSPTVLQKMQITFRDDESLLQHSTMEQLLNQGFIPYATNEKEFGFLMSRKGYKSDIESAAAKERQYEISQLYFRNQSDFVSQNITDNCKGFSFSSVLTTNLTSDVEESIARSWQYINEENEEIDILKPKAQSVFEKFAAMIFQKIISDNNHFHDESNAVQVPIIVDLGENMDGSENEEPLIYELPKEARTVVLICIFHPQFSKGCILEVAQQENICRMELKTAEAVIIPQNIANKVALMLPQTLLQIFT